MDLRHTRGLLSDRDVDADHVATPLVEDGVEENRGLTRRAVADHKFALATTDRNHRVDRLEARLKRLYDWLAMHDARSLELERSNLVGRDRSAAVERLAERIDDSTDHPFADRDTRDTAGALDDLALFDRFPRAEECGADVVLLQQVEGQTGDACSNSSISFAAQLSSP